jgi:hypothetical protein
VRSRAVLSGSQAGMAHHEDGTMTDDDYAKLARLLDEAAREHRKLATVSGDPVERYQAGVNADFFIAARNAAKDHQPPSRNA